MSRKTTDQKFENIATKLTNVSKYNHNTRKKNRAYLDKYITTSATSNKAYVHERVMKATGLLKQLNLLDSVRSDGVGLSGNDTDIDGFDNSRHAGAASETSRQHARNLALRTRKAPRVSNVVSPVSTATKESSKTIGVKESPTSTVMKGSPKSFNSPPVDVDSYNRASVSESEHDEEYAKLEDEKRLELFKQKLAECKKICGEQEKELKELEEFLSKKKIEGITLPQTNNLFDLLVERILDTEKDWKEKIDVLINIPHSLPGEYLRGGDYFEALFQLAIVIGILPYFSGKYVKMYDLKGYKPPLIEHPNYLHTKPIKNSGGSEQGISDITFKVSSNPDDFTVVTDSGYKCGEVPKRTESSIPLYFISVKGYRKEKSIKDGYDIPLLTQQISMLPEELNKRIMVCVRNEEQFKSKLSRTKIEFLKGYPVIGYDAVMDAFTEFRVNFFNRFGDKLSKKEIGERAKELFPENVIQKPMLSLYFHQQLIVKACIERIIEQESKTKPHYLCIGVLPRGGKSFIAGGIINEHMSFKSKKTGYNVLFLTSAISETRKQFRDDLIQKFADFASFNFIDVVKADDEEELKVDGRNVSSKNNFYFISRQLSQMKEENPKKEHVSSIINPEADILASLRKKLGVIPSFDICFFDEAHIGIISDSVRKNFDKVFNKFPGVPIVLMTATYKAPAVVLDSPKDLFVWDLEDIKEMKALPVKGLLGFDEKAPDFYDRFQNKAKKLLEGRLENGETLEHIAKPYIQFPNPNFINLTFAPETIKDLFDSGSGYSYEKAFKINKDDALLSNVDRWAEWLNLITHKEQAKNLRIFLTPEQDKHDTILIDGNRKFRALNQIFRIAQKNGSRPSPIKPFSILMFLPMLPEQNVGRLCRVWASFLLQLPYWKDTFIALVLSPMKYSRSSSKLDEHIERGFVLRDDYPGRDLKELIQEVERKALEKNKGLLLLSGDVAKMGISLPCVDVVCLMSNNNDADDIIQKMYRALTDNPPNKKDGFIIDLDLKRIVTAFFDYDLSKDKMRWNSSKALTVEDRLIKLGDLCNWGYDSFIEDGNSTNFNDVMTQIKSRVFDQIKLRIFTEASDSKLEKDQKKLIESDTSLRDDFIEALYNTSFKKGTKIPKPEELSRRGSSIPDESKGSKANGSGEESKNDGNGDRGEALKPAVKPVEPFIPDPGFMAQIYTKIFKITKTFINALVVKSAIPLDKSLNIEALLEKYYSDKKTSKGGVSCSCKNANECVKTHDNLYDTVFCELKAYAMKKKKTDKDKDIYEFNPETHNAILQAVDRMFTRSPNIVEWNIYIEKFLKELRSRKIGGGRKIFTFRRKNGKRSARYTRKIQ